MNSRGAVGGGQYVGARVTRVEDDRFLRGHGQYVDDLALPGMLHVAFVRSPHAHALIRSIDLTTARAHPGVVAAYAGADVRDHLGPIVVAPYREEMVETTQPVLPSDRVRYVGEAVAVVVAVSRYVAEDACQLVEVDWDPLPAVLDPEAALMENAPQMDEGVPSNNVAHIVWDGGDSASALAEADRVFTKRFVMGRSAGMPLETRGLVASLDHGSGELTVWVSSQFPHLTRTSLAAPLGMPERRIRVIAPAVGGGFGVKVAIYAEDIVVPALALVLGRPVKWIEDRYEHLAASSHSKEMVCELQLGVDLDGTFRAITGHFTGNGGAYSTSPFTALVDPLPAAGMIFNQYAIPAGRSVIDAPLSNKCPTAAYRGVGWTSGHTAREVLIDDVARALDIDPVEIRLKNTIDSAPYKTPFGQQYDGGSYRDALVQAREVLAYDKFRDDQQCLRDEGRYLGIGFSPYVEPGGWGTPIHQANGFAGNMYDTASVTVHPDGAVVVTTGLHSQGQGHETTFAQLVADRLGVPMDDVKLVQGDTATAAFGFGTYASRSVTVAAGSLGRAADDVRAKLLKLAAQALEVSEQDLDLREGVAAVRGAPDRSITVAELVAGVYWAGAALPDGEEVALTSTRSYEPGESYSNGTVAAIVEVDVETGLVDLKRIVHVEDCGTMVNPTIVEGQMSGAIAQGVGMALYEEVVYDDSGELLTSNLMDYLYPTSMEVPHLELEHIETPSPTTDTGIKGMGEAGSIGAPAAILNAIADALAPFKIEIETAPMTPERILAALRERRGEKA